MNYWIEEIFYRLRQSQGIYEDINYFTEVKIDTHTPGKERYDLIYFFYIYFLELTL
jgi:hypothetical protein